MQSFSDRLSIPFDFEAPAFLFLLLLLPLFCVLGRRSLSALGQWRQRIALWLRLSVASLLIMALAEPNWLRLLQRLTVIFVVDASASIERGELDSALKYINAAAQQRVAARNDRAAAIVFGRAPAVEAPPATVRWQIPRVESAIDPRFTNLESALQLAEVTFPPDSARRVVLVSDGSENVGAALPQVSRMLEAGIGFDCVPISYQRRGEIAVEKVIAPAEIRRGAPFTVSVVLNNVSTQAVAGTLHITRELAGHKDAISAEHVTLSPGKRVLSLKQELLQPGMTTFEARFAPDQPADDAHTENNAATAFCHIAGNGRVLVIEDASQPGRFDVFVEMLRGHDLEVTVRDTRRPFDNLTDLQEFDCVVLADVARVAGEATNDLTQLTDHQVHALVQNTEHLGCGLIVLGGPNSYGAGGWANSELEQALPVDCQIQNAKVNAVGALMLVIDCSGSMAGEKLSWSKAAAVAASQMLGERDFLGVVAFDSEPHWIVPLKPNASSDRTKAQIDRLAAAGGTHVMPALAEAYRAIQQANASIKHVIVLTDGHSPHEGCESLVSAMRDKGVTTTGVAVGRDADSKLLANIGQRGGGKFYQVFSPNSIPRVFMREARRVARPLVFEDAGGIPVETAAAHEALTGVGPAPPITGLVLTTLKESALVDVLLSTPRQPQPNSAILAAWQFGLGRSVALTTDVGQRWAADWPQSANYEKLMMQVIRWAMRHHDASEMLTLSTASHEGSIKLIATALDPENENANYLSLSGTAVLPNGAAHPFPFEQTEPGRYLATVPAAEPGNYYLAVSTSNGAMLRTAVNLAATAEFMRLASNDGFLAEIAEGVPRGGQRGAFLQAPHGIADTAGLLATNVFRPGVPFAKSRTAAWPLFLVATSLVFFCDVFCRRVLVSREWFAPLSNWLFTRSSDLITAEAIERIDRLRKSKAEATARFALQEAAISASAADPLHAPSSAAISPPAAAIAEPSAPAIAPDSTTAGDPNTSVFTSRLLDAKRRLRDSRQRRD